MGNPSADNSFNEIAGQIAQYPPEELEWYHRYPTAGGDPVVVPGAPDQPLSSIFAQMSPFDSLILVMGHFDGLKRRLVWVVISGIAAGYDVGNPPIGLDEFGLRPDSSLAEVFKTAVRDERLTATGLLAPA